MIRHPERIGQVSAALLLLGRPHTTAIREDKIIVDNGFEKQTFYREEDYMMWLLSEIQEVVAKDLSWFMEHHHKESEDA